MNKKAIVFTFIVIALLSVILIAFIINVSNKNTQARIQDTNVNVETLNSFTKSLDEQLIPQALRASSNQAILSWLRYLDAANNETGYLGSEFLTAQVSLNDNFRNAALFESYNKVSETLQLHYMTNVTDKANFTLPSIFKEIEVLANNSGVVFNYSDPGQYIITVKQDSAWEINVTMQIQNYQVLDNLGHTFWNFNDKNYSIILNVTNYEDPFILVLDNRSVTINKTAFTTATFDLTNFRTFYETPEFIAHGDAPSFFQRLQGLGINTNEVSFTPDGNGIETILDPLYYPNPSGYSSVDFEYWDGKDGCIIEGFENIIYLSNTPGGDVDDHIDFYNRVNADSDPLCSG